MADDNIFRSKVVWLSGASSGIGKALAVELALRGARLILTGRNEQKLTALADGLAGDSHRVLPMDLADIEAIPAAVEEAWQTAGHIDYLFCNAGVSQRALVADTLFSVDQRIMNVNFFAPIRMSKAILPLMKADGGGHIVVTGSLTGRLYTPKRSAYAASKHALMGWFGALRAEAWRENIRVTLVLPGFVRTNLSIAALEGDGNARGTMDKVIENGMAPEKAAQRILRGVSRGKEEIVFGGFPEMIALALMWVSPRLYSALAKRIRIE